jgi:predicted nucleic acid-binding Zn ribbon protein
MLKEAVARDEVLKASRAQQVLRDWDSIVGTGLASRSHPDRYDHGTVWVAVESSAWAQELRMSKETILAKLREKSSEGGLFQDIRFGVRPIHKDQPLINEPFDEQAHKDSLKGLSIREIAEKRLQNWRQEKG